MPTYDYSCQNCGYLWEEFHAITTKPIESCPQCKEKSAQKLIGKGAGVHFSGSGFYETDYKRKEQKD